MIEGGTLTATGREIAAGLIMTTAGTEAMIVIMTVDGTTTGIMTGTMTATSSA